MIQRRVITGQEGGRHLPIQWKVTERPTIQRRVITAQEEGRHLPIQWKVTERSMIPRRVMTAKEEERHLPMQWKVTDDSGARDNCAGGGEASADTMESFDGARVRPRAYISWQSDPLKGCIQAQLTEDIQIRAVDQEDQRQLIGARETSYMWVTVI